MDLVGTCPKDFWAEWIAEGDPAGEPWSGEEWGWYTEHSLIAKIQPGDRFYVVAHGKLRGAACTIPGPIPGFRGLRVRWWHREAEDVCERPSFRIYFDHCHAQGHFRGWLCHHCNIVLGHAKDDPAILRKLAAYLEK